MCVCKPAGQKLFLIVSDLKFLQFMRRVFFEEVKSIDMVDPARILLQPSDYRTVLIPQKQPMPRDRKL